MNLVLEGNLIFSWIGLLFGIMWNLRLAKKSPEAGANLIE